jgi:hypothetical protein
LFLCPEAEGATVSIFDPAPNVSKKKQAGRLLFTDLINKSVDGQA